ncbi:hypothetical protein TRFO_23356 [Tritrichomonas foetus]|uniref:Major facilitator superfamily (MFS) profile domain-containing protein n=1 Tax=Tritrichomonas foetus TaxID=1144522 RepID=A0A1J4KEM8_9EUKA|nr:hypothetical protein TRFO_23356 [Tritrichomonas foetus]|eukprot:OHT08204.1 hypothetical protein TRFO_23356 [Tritrichomonas foetus]
MPFCDISLLHAAVIMFAPLEFGAIMVYPSPTGPTIRAMHNLSPHAYEWSLYNAIPCLTSIAGTFLNRYLINKFHGSRKKAIFVFDIIAIVFWLLNLLTRLHIWAGIAVRMCLGIALGGFGALGPMYLVEIAPEGRSGFYGALNQGGIVFAQCLFAILEPSIHYDGLCYLGAGIAALQAIMIGFVDESPAKKHHFESEKGEDDDASVSYDNRVMKMRKSYSHSGRGSQFRSNRSNRSHSRGVKRSYTEDNLAGMTGKEEATYYKYSDDNGNDDEQKNAQKHVEKVHNDHKNVHHEKSDYMYFSDTDDLESEWSEKVVQAPKKKRIRKKEPLFQSKYAKSIIIGVTLMFIRQFSGINGILTNLADIMNEAGLDLNGSYQAGIATCAQIIGIFVGSPLIDKIGRKLVWIISASIICVSLLIFALNEKFAWTNIIPLICTFTYQLGFGLGIGLITWILVPEYFPHIVRPAAQTFCNSCNWVFCFIIIMCFEQMKTSLTMFGILIFFLVICLLSILFGMYCIYDPDKHDKLHKNHNDNKESQKTIDDNIENDENLDERAKKIENSVLCESSSEVSSKSKEASNGPPPISSSSSGSSISLSTPIETVSSNSTTTNSSEMTLKQIEP